MEGGGKLTLAEMGNNWSASRAVKQESLRNIRKQLWVVHDGRNTTTLAEQARQFRPYKKPKQDDASRDSMAGSSLEISMGKGSGAVGEVRVSHDFEGLCSNEGENMLLLGEHNVVPVTPAKMRCKPHHSMANLCMAIAGKSMTYARSDIHCASSANESQSLLSLAKVDGEANAEETCIHRRFEESPARNRHMSVRNTQNNSVPTPVTFQKDFKVLNSTKHGGPGGFITALCVAINQQKIRLGLLLGKDSVVTPAQICTAIGGKAAFGAKVEGHMQDHDISRQIIRNEALMGLCKRPKSLYKILREASPRHQAYSDLCNSCQEVKLNEGDVQLIADLCGCCVLLEDAAGNELVTKCTEECRTTGTNALAEHVCIQLRMNALAGLGGLQSAGVCILRLQADGLTVAFEADAQWCSMDATPLAMNTVKQSKKEEVMINSDTDKAHELPKVAVQRDFRQAPQSKPNAQTSNRAAMLLANAQQQSRYSGAGTSSNELDVKAGPRTQPGTGGVINADRNSHSDLGPFLVKDWKSEFDPNFREGECTVRLTRDILQRTAQAYVYYDRTMIGCVLQAYGMSKRTAGGMVIKAFSNKPFQFSDSRISSETATLVWQLEACQKLQSHWNTREWKFLRARNNKTKQLLESLSYNSAYAGLYRLLILERTVLWENWWVESEQSASGVTLRVHPAKGVCGGGVFESGPVSEDGKVSGPIPDHLGRPFTPVHGDYHAQLLHLSTHYDCSENGSHYVVACGLNVLEAPFAFDNVARECNDARAGASAAVLAKDISSKPTRSGDGFALFTMDSMNSDLDDELKENLVLTMGMLGNLMQNMGIRAPGLNSNLVVPCVANLACAPSAPSRAHDIHGTKALKAWAKKYTYRVPVPAQEGNTCALHTAQNVIRLSAACKEEMSKGIPYPHASSMFWEYVRPGNRLGSQGMKAVPTQLGASRLDAACTLLWFRRKMLQHVRDVDSANRHLIDALTSSIQRMTGTEQQSRHGSTTSKSKKIQPDDEFQDVPWHTCNKSRNEKGTGGDTYTQ